jgi:hypothetical protein
MLAEAEAEGEVVVERVSAAAKLASNKETEGILKCILTN